jgi:hypothetical protein
MPDPADAVDSCRSRRGRRGREGAAMTRIRLTQLGSLTLLLAGFVS